MSVAPQTLTGTFFADPDHSSFQFAVKHMRVVTFRATFEDVSVAVVGDDEGLRVEGAAQVESVTIRTPAAFREHVVYDEGFFDARRHPTIDFRSTAVAVDGDGATQVEGELTIRGVTRGVTATGTLQPPVEDPYGLERSALELRATIDRRNWGMDWQQELPKGGDVLGWDVELTIFVELVKQG